MKYNWGPALFRRLSGVFCIYKPTGLPVFKVLETIQGNLTRDVNALPCYKYERRINRWRPTVDGDSRLPTISSLPAATDDVSKHRLALGPRYVPEDFVLKPLHGLSRHSSGVLIVGLRQGCEYLPQIALSRFLRVYHVRGRLGWATDNFSPKGKIIERTTFNHVTKPLMDRICASAQANHTKHMFEYAGVLSDSQEAYELAVSGLIRPASGKTPPILYGVKCIQLNPPEFTLEIHAINEKTSYLMNLINDIGLSMKTTAVCTHIRRIRYGHFELEHALLRQHWTAQGILGNINYCRKLLRVDKLFTDANVKQLDTGQHRLLDRWRDEIDTISSS